MRLFRKQPQQRLAPPVEESPEWWTAEALRQENLANQEVNLWRYFEMLRNHAVESINWVKVFPFFALPLAIQAERMVELGSSFSYYPETYGNDPTPFLVSSEASEGAVSTRIMLSACRLLSQLGVPARLISVDIRAADHYYYQHTERLIREMHLSSFWQPVMGTDSLEWLRGQKRASIDFALVDSNHTYNQVLGELEGLRPLMSARGLILVDDCYETNYRHGLDWIPEESDAGMRRGGEYGAIREFLSRYEEWSAEWMPQLVLLSRTWGTAD